MSLFRDENLILFTSIMNCSLFKRCISDELISIEDEKISIVYSGQIGLRIKNLNK